MILGIGLSHGIRIDMLDKMVDSVNFDNQTEIEALEKVKILYFKSMYILKYALSSTALLGAHCKPIPVMKTGFSL